MGGKASKAEVKRTKSFSMIGRSSQKSLFQRSRNKLNEINKSLNDSKPPHTDLQQKFDLVEKEIRRVSEIIKEKHKEKYEDIVKYLEETREKVLNKTRIPVIVVEEAPKALREHALVEEDCQANIVSFLEEKIELRRGEERRNAQQDAQEEEGTEVRINNGESPKVKFGVQVMPIDPRVSQEMLKRKTLPINEVPRAEFERIRKDSETTENSVSHQSSPNEEYFSENPFKELQKAVELNALQELQLITESVDKLEVQLKYFHGTKKDDDYIELYESFVRDLMRVDNVEALGDPVVKTEKRIVIFRVKELINILETLVEETPTKEDIPAICSVYDNRRLECSDGLTNAI